MLLLVKLSYHLNKSQQYLLKNVINTGYVVYYMLINYHVDNTYIHRHGLDMLKIYLNEKRSISIWLVR